MAHKFTVWVQQPVVDTNIQSATSFNSDAQTENGFQAGATASAIRVNTALRQANLVITALMEVILSSSSTASVESSVSDLAAEISTRLLIDPHIQNGSADRSIQNGGTASGIGSVSFGESNLITHKNAFGFGVGLVSGRDNQTLVGQFNSPSNSALFGVGYGTGVNDKKTAFFVDQNGNVIVTTPPTTPTSAARKTDLPVGSDSVPPNIDDESSSGVSPDFSRADHTHKGVRSIRLNSTDRSYGDVGPFYAPVNTGSTGQVLVASGNQNTPPSFSNENVGSYRKPIYLNGGVPTGMSSTIGSLSQPIWMESGELKAGNPLFIDSTSSSPSQLGLFAVTIRRNNTNQYTTVIIRTGQIGPNDTSTIFTSSIGVLDPNTVPYDSVWVTYRRLNNSVQFRVGAYPTSASNFTIVKVIKLSTMAWE